MAIHTSIKCHNSTCFLLWNLIRGSELKYRNNYTRDVLSEQTLWNEGSSYNIFRLEVAQQTITNGCNGSKHYMITLAECLIYTYCFSLGHLAIQVKMSNW